MMDVNANHRMAQHFIKCAHEAASMRGVLAAFTCSAGTSCGRQGAEETGSLAQQREGMQQPIADAFSLPADLSPVFPGHVPAAQSRDWRVRAGGIVARQAAHVRFSVCMPRLSRTETRWSV